MLCTASALKRIGVRWTLQNAVRLLQMKDQKGREYVPDIIDDICDDLEIDLRMIFSPIPSFY